MWDYLYHVYTNQGVLKMAGPAQEKKPEWVTRKGGGGKRYEVRDMHRYSYRISLNGPELADVPKEDYEPCSPPVEDVTSRVYVNNGSVYIDRGYGSLDDDKVATLCCNGNYKVSFNPFKVEKIA